MLLKLENVVKRFGGNTAVNGFSMGMEQEEIIGIIGPNGAGKTTIFNLISGIYSVDEGDITLEDESILRIPQELRAKRGIGRTFQNIRLFPTLDVLSNVKISFDQRPTYSMLEAIMRLPRAIRSDRNTTKEALECLELVGLTRYKNDKPENLPYGLQRRLEIARALALKPKVFMLDEPAAGLNPDECMELVRFLKALIAREKIGILIIEHRMDVIMNLCDRIYVQDFGTNIAVGTPEEIQRDPKVLSAYLGGNEDAAQCQ